MISAQQSPADPRLSVLILSPHPSVHGGVSTFIETVKDHLKNTQASALWVGSVQGKRETAIQQFTRLFTVPLQLISLLRRRRIDVVHLNPSLTMKSTLRDGLILGALKIVGFKHTLIYFHGWEESVRVRLAKHAWTRRLFVHLLGSARLILVLSPDYKRTLVETGIPAEKIVVTRTLFNSAGMKPLQPANASARQTILFMSRFDREKGGKELLEAFLRLAPEYPDYDLILAGDGDDGPVIRANAAAANLGSRVQLPGYVRGEAKLKLLRECAIYALPTYMMSEGMPVALLEAMGAGKPLLTAKAGGIPYIIRDPENGVVLEKVSAATIEQGLRKLMSDAAYREAVGEHNARYAWERFEASIVTAEIEGYYRQVAAAG